jgi:hypothetical protein
MIAGCSPDRRIFESSDLNRVRIDNWNDNLWFFHGQAAFWRCDQPVSGFNATYAIARSVPVEYRLITIALDKRT